MVGHPLHQVVIVKLDYFKVIFYDQVGNYRYTLRIKLNQMIVNLKDNLPFHHMAFDLSFIGSKICIDNK